MAFVCSCHARLRIGLLRNFQGKATGPGRLRFYASTPPKPPPHEAVPVPTTIPPLPLWQRLGPLTRMSQAYARAQRKRPYVTQVCTALCIYFAADMSVQSMSTDDYDPYRTLRSLTIGAIAAIPGFHWFVWLSKLNIPGISNRWLSISAKVIINQIAFTPIFNSYFFGMQALLAGGSLAEAWLRIRECVPTSIVNSVKLWPFVTAVNFAWVPLEHRAAFAGLFAVGWQTYLAFLNRKAEDLEAANVSVQGAKLTSQAAVA